MIRPETSPDHGAEAWQHLIKPLGPRSRSWDHEDVLQATALSLWRRLGDEPDTEQAKRLRAVVFERRRLDLLRQRRRFPDLLPVVEVPAEVRSAEFVLERQLRLECDLVQLLGDRGVELLLAISKGVRTNSALARHLSLDVKTVRRHRERVRELLDAYRNELDGFSAVDSPGRNDL